MLEGYLSFSAQARTFGPQDIRCTIMGLTLAAVLPDFSGTQICPFGTIHHLTCGNVGTTECLPTCPRQDPGGNQRTSHKTHSEQSILPLSMRCQELTKCLTPSVSTSPLSSPFAPLLPLPAPSQVEKSACRPGWHDGAACIVGLWCGGRVVQMEYECLQTKTPGKLTFIQCGLSCARR